MKTLFFIFIATCVFFDRVDAQNYLIDFAVSTNTPLDIVKVDNLTTGESLTINGSDVLNLKGNLDLTGIVDNNLPSSGIKIYPNPMADHAQIDIFPPLAGDAVITIVDLSGMVIAHRKDYVDNSLQMYKLSGQTAKGVYIVSVRGTHYQLSGKLISNGSSTGTISIEKITGSISEKKIPEKDFKSSFNGNDGSIKEMLYSSGNRLKFTAVSGDYQTVLTDVPDMTKTIVFDIKECIDSDGNNYHTVEIDGRLWSEENLKTTKYNNGTFLPLIADSASWSRLISPAYCWYKNNDAKYKNPYGALYNGYVIKAGDVCPEGWHISTDAEWTSLRDFLSTNGYAFGTNSNAIAKSIASTSGWDNYSYVQVPRGPEEVIGAVGKNQETTNNSSGFSGYPGGLRSFDGSFSNIGKTGIWYSAVAISSQPDAGLWDWFLNYNDMQLGQGSDDKACGFSIRCVQN